MSLLVTSNGDRVVLESCRDITARRLAEEGLRQAQKMEAVGQLTGGIAHDFNNLLTIILANLQLLGDELAPGSLGTDLAASATRAAQRGAELTRKLLVFARRQRLEATSLDINALVSSMIGMLARTLGEHIRIVELLGPRLPAVFVDAGQLETALLNLAVNARDAMPEGGRLSLATREVTVNDDGTQREGGLTPGAYVVVDVSDTGTGMSREVAARAFEPFFTTKESGKGTGLGLSMVYGFAKQSGGHVSLDSNPGQGTVVRLYLPQARGDEVAAYPQAGIQAGGTEVVMLVEDDDEVRAATRLLLAGLGYRVVEAADTATALSLLGRIGEVHLLLTDVVLGQGSSGTELAREAQRRRPDLRVLFMSGYVRDIIAFQEQLEGKAHFLEKPFRKEQLAEKLRLALGSRPD
jgi:nitrogen-specific signal transduction histidine kinase/ActR/RegA family two-component response regulator